MSEPPPELIGRLKGLVAQVMRETDPQRYDELASELWLVLERLTNIGLQPQGRPHNP